MNHSSKAGRGYNFFRVGDLAQSVRASVMSMAIRCLTPRTRVQFPEWETFHNIKCAVRH